MLLLACPYDVRRCALLSGFDYTVAVPGHWKKYRCLVSFGVKTNSSNVFFAIRSLRVSLALLSNIRLALCSGFTD